MILMWSLLLLFFVFGCICYKPSAIHAKRIGEKRIHTGQVIGTLIGGLGITTNYVAETVDGRMSTFLRMGNDVGFKDGQKIHHTLLLPGESHYFVTLEGISVQGVCLQIDPGASPRTPDHNGGCLLDTGSPWTAIHRKEYDIVKSAMQAHFSAFHMEQVPGMFDLCYLNRNQQRLPYPCMTFHFHGADLELGPTQLFLRTLDGFCFIYIVGFHDHEFFFLFSLEVICKPACGGYVTAARCCRWYFVY